MRAAALLVGVVACADAPVKGWCPAGEHCSPLAPEGLAIGEPPIHHWTVAAHLAVGGSGHYPLEVPHTDREDYTTTYTPLDVPYTATVDDSGIVVSQAGNVVTLRALANSGDRTPSGLTATLDVRDAEGLLLGRATVVTAPIADITAAPLTPDGCSVDPQAIFAPGGPVVIVLSSSTPDEALYDDSLRVTGSQQLAWDVIEAPLATGTVTVVAGDHAPVDLVIPVATDVALAECPAPSYVEYGNVDLCFEARSGGHVVTGAAWQFTVDGVPVAHIPLEPTCIHASAQPMATSMTVVAAAAGASLTVMLPVI